MGLYPEEYPQIYPAWEIRESISGPRPPLEPKEPKPVDTTPPSKYPNLAENLKYSSFCLLAFGVSLLLCFWVYNPFVFFLLVSFSIGSIVFLCKSYNSLIESKTYKERLSSHQKTIEEYNVAYEKYKEMREKYIEERQSYDELAQSLKNQEDIMAYRLNQRLMFLKSVKSKERHRWFYDLGKYKSPKVGRAEILFREYINQKKANNIIPSDFDFFFDASVEVSSFKSLRVSFFYPDLLVLTPRGLMIDVEIDEPYSADSKKPIHAIHSLDNNDFGRNQYFTKNNCNVIRFTERQIIRYPEICLRIILQFDDFASIPSDMILPDDFKEKSWTDKDAELMAKNDYRNTY